MGGENVAPEGDFAVRKTCQGSTKSFGNMAKAGVQMTRMRHLE